MTPFEGTGVALVTPFTTEGDIDFPALRKLAEHVIAGGVEYLVLMGTTGESVTLASEEQHAAIEAVLDVNNGRLPVVLGCGGNNTHAVARQLDVLGTRYDPAGFLSVVPYYNKPSQDGMYRHYAALAAATDRPILLYNVPGRTGSNLLPPTASLLAQDFDNIVALKEASGDVSQCMSLVQEVPAEFGLLSGDDPLALAQIALGFRGVISVISNAFPAEFSGMIRAARAGDVETARREHYRLLALIRLNLAEGNPTGVKAHLSNLGLCGPDVRLPLAPASAELMERSQAAIEALHEPAT